MHTARLSSSEKASHLPLVGSPQIGVIPAEHSECHAGSCSQRHSGQGDGCGGGVGQRSGRVAAGFSMLKP